jgi:hypothetical protein
VRGEEFYLEEILEPVFYTVSILDVTIILDYTHPELVAYVYVYVYTQSSANAPALYKHISILSDDVLYAPAEVPFMYACDGYMLETELFQGQGCNLMYCYNVERRERDNNMKEHKKGEG